MAHTRRAFEHPVHTVEQTKVYGDSTKRQELVHKWADVIANTYDTDGYKTDGSATTAANDANMVARYISTKFKYELEPTPLRENTPNYWLGASSHAFHKTNTADCVLANTIVAMQDPEYGVVDGYLNKPSNGNTNVLSTREMHLMAVNQQGDIIDATPQNIPEGSGPSLDAYFDDSNVRQASSANFDAYGESKHDLPFNPTKTLGYAALLFGGIMAYGSRKRVAARAQEMRKNVATKLLAKRTDDEVMTAVLASEQAQYAPEATPEQVRARLARVKQNKQSTEVINKVLMPYIHDKAAHKIIKSKMPKSRERKTAARTLRLARWANQ